MKKWKRINKSDRKKLRKGKVRLFLRGFMDEAFNHKKHRFLTVGKI